MAQSRATQPVSIAGASVLSMLSAPLQSLTANCGLQVQRCRLGRCRLFGNRYMNRDHKLESVAHCYYQSDTRFMADLTPNPIPAGGSTQSAITLNTVNGFSSAISFRSLVQPSPPLAQQCSVSPNSVAPGTPATLTIKNDCSTMAQASPSGRSALLYALWIPVFGLT